MNDAAALTVEHDISNRRKRHHRAVGRRRARGAAGEGVRRTAFLSRPRGRLSPSTARARPHSLLPSASLLSASLPYLSHDAVNRGALVAAAERAVVSPTVFHVGLPRDAPRSVRDEQPRTVCGVCRPVGFLLLRWRKRGGRRMR
jgi:hypothetical protein